LQLDRRELHVFVWLVDCTGAHSTLLSCALSHSSELLLARLDTSASEQLAENERLMKELAESREDKEARSKHIQEEREAALKQMGIALKEDGGSSQITYPCPRVWILPWSISVLTLLLLSFSRASGSDAAEATPSPELERRPAHVRTAPVLLVDRGRYSVSLLCLRFDPFAQRRITLSCDRSYLPCLYS